MEVKFLDLTKDYGRIKDKIEKAVCDQLRQGVYIGGKAVEDFEKNFAEYIGVRNAIGVNSGTDALVIALKALGIGMGDEVITSPFTFFATAEAISMTGAIPVFVDIDEDSYNIDPLKIEEKINKNTKAILPVHIFGQPADMDKITKLADKYGLKIVEDACQAAGAMVGERKAGSFGNAACFSFYPTKNLGGIGDGGMITTNDDSVATICRALRAHGSAKDGADARYLLEGKKDSLPDMDSCNSLYHPDKYYNYLIAYNSRLDAVQARVLDIRLEYLDEYNRIRKQIAQFYMNALKQMKQIMLPKTMSEVSPVWHQYAFRCLEKDELGVFLGSRGIGSAAFYRVPLHLQKAFDYLGYQEGDLPVSEMIAKQTVCLPIYPGLTQDELSYVVACIQEFYETKKVIE